MNVVGEPQPNEATPVLRFPEFVDAGAWRREKLSALLFESRRRNSLLRFDVHEVLSVSGEYGCVNQIEHMGRSYAGANLRDYRIVGTGDLVYTKSPLKRNPFGIIKANKGGAGIVSTLYAVYSTTELADASFLDYYFSRDYNLNRYLQPIVRKGAKNDMKVNNSAVLGGELFVPGTAEQKKVAAFFDSLDELARFQRQKVEALRAYKRGLIQQLFPQEGARVPRLRFPEFRNRSEWNRVELHELGSLVSGLTYSPDEVRDEGLLVLRSSNVQGAEIALDDCVYVTPDVTGANICRPGDILICVRNGSKSLIGKSAIIPAGMPACTPGAFMTVFRSERPQFAFQLLQTPQFYSQVAAALGATINSINSKRLLRYHFAVPDPDEQLRIADFLSLVDIDISLANRKLTALKATRVALLQQLFASAGDA